jgi:hypothetical protein
MDHLYVQYLHCVYSDQQRTGCMLQAVLSFSSVFGKASAIVFQGPWSEALMWLLMVTAMDVFL